VKWMVHFGSVFVNRCEPPSLAPDTPLTMTAKISPVDAPECVVCMQPDPGCAPGEYYGMT
jgi:hypothetical protein